MNKYINITLPDGSIREFPFGVSIADVAFSISEGLLRNSVAGKINGKIKDLNTVIEDDALIEIITNRSSEAHEVLLHSTAHLMAQAIKELYPDAKIAIGPALENKFYYDIDVETAFTEESLQLIEKKMKELSKAKYDINRLELSREDALKIFKEQSEDYKVELINELESDVVISAYQQGEFIDLCRGPHLPSTGKIKYFKLLSNSAAYWRGDDSNKMLQRIYGTAFFDKKELKNYLFMLEEAKKRDHRKIGKELDLFMFDDEVGQGLPMWLPNGAIMIEELETLAKDTENEAGYSRVKTPHITKSGLYETS